MMDERYNICEKCKYFQCPIPDATDNSGECRRYPPKEDTRWPIVQKQDWCGEFRPKKS
jgi:hypothetical protein